MSRKHLAVGVDIDALVLCLIKKLLDIFKIVTGYNNEWAFFNSQGNGYRYRISEGLCVCTVKKLHAGQVKAANLHNNRKQLVHAPILRQRIECS